jgi:hypothetical protein
VKRRSWPLLAASLGQAWPDASAASVARRAPLGALRDGWDLARELSRRGEQDVTAAVELAEREVSIRHRDGRPRRLPALRRRPGGAVVQVRAGYATSRVIDVAHPTFPDARTVGVAS